MSRQRGGDFARECADDYRGDSAGTDKKSCLTLPLPEKKYSLMKNGDGESCCSERYTICGPNYRGLSNQGNVHTEQVMKYSLSVNLKSN